MDPRPPASRKATSPVSQEATEILHLMTSQLTMTVKGCRFPVMLSLPSSRRYLLPALILFVIAILIKAINHGKALSTKAVLERVLLSTIQRGIVLSIENTYNQRSSQLLTHASTEAPSPFKDDYYTYIPISSNPQRNAYFAPLLTCALVPNPHTNHVRLLSIVRNITQSTPDSRQIPGQRLFNPTIFALPSWSQHHYLIVSRVVTEGLHQESLVCFADLCHHPDSRNLRGADSAPCDTSSLAELGFSGGMHCSTPLSVLSIPPTPALQCDGPWEAFPSIPGFHDPRIFWSGKGEPLIILNSASQYACVGLWMMDLRALEPRLKNLIEELGNNRATVAGGGPLMSYPSLTELTRNPASDRGAVEKNWFLFFGSEPSSTAEDNLYSGDEAFIHYDIFPSHPSHRHSTSILRSNAVGRTFAKLIGNGFTTENLTDPLELPCPTNVFDSRGRRGDWHQASNALKLLLCTRAEAKRGHCDENQAGRVVNFAVAHRKFSNNWDLPLRYERYFVVWDARKPFHLLGLSRFPVLFWNETASGWTAQENWAVELDEEKATSSNWTSSVKRGTKLRNETGSVHESMRTNVGKNWAYFTYTPSIAWAWRPLSSSTKRHGADRNGHDWQDLRSMHMGYLDDEVVLGIGLDDTRQAFAKAEARTLLQCLRACSEEFN